ncbi:hypothetical protein CH330_05160 [candidate division WOR-3 bacterium JGI_Cruoil_03_51_56]|uniref:Formylmethanofuran dehydrogenase subunit E domain-containing protein n=1 Tax=candidate division WOR-3 bacterium JGI_Cruoil_03_51_56 TaxID=1973747 RepID=A0A235BT21_UNCW3|nr:MAG: hypothetical protein CH330_05160 [candidate division WOR-3 bacterium JGI_Cruoil_03_51_56]
MDKFSLDFTKGKTIFPKLKKNQIIKAAARFHGHIGPWIVLGLRTGRYAQRVLGGSPFELDARVHCPAKLPYSCFLDGVQLASGCTMGKGNIHHISSSRVWVEFSRKKSTGARFISEKPGKVKASLRIELRPEVWTELHLKHARTIAATEKLSRDIYYRPFNRLFLKTRRI